MKQSRSKPVELKIEAPDNATEIFLIGADLRRIASGAGQLSAKVPAGLYKVRYRSGAAQHDQLVRVPESDIAVVVQAQFVEFRAAAPIGYTSTTHEYQSAPAAVESRKTHISLGSGAQLYLCVREESEKEQWRGCDIGIHGLDGRLLAKIDAGFLDDHARFAALNVELDPGTYAIRVSSGALGPYELFLTASPGWQTQVFFIFENFWVQDVRVRAPSLRKASLLMAHIGAGFDPYRPISRTAELARQALVQGRDVVSEDFLKMLLEEKYEDPMLGIIGAHLLLRRRQHDLDLLHIVCRNLGDLLGTHPDVQSLKLALGQTEGMEVAVIEAPPSLRQSWEEITKATRRRAGLVPHGSVVARIAADVVRGSPWLLRKVPTSVRGAPASEATIAGAVRAADQIMGQNPELLGRLAAGSEAAQLNNLERTVLDAAAAIARSRSLLKRSKENTNIYEQRSAKSMLSGIDAPSYAIASAVMSLAEKLDLKS